MIHGTKQRPAVSLVIKVFGLKKDFPTKDYLKKKGWDYSVTFCVCGNILYADRTYCPSCKGTQASTVRCTCKKPYGKK